MLEGKVPFSKREDYSLQYKQSHSQTTKDFLQGLLQVDPGTRLGSKGYLEVINHPFFESVDFGKLAEKEYALGLEVKLKGPQDLQCFREKGQEWQVDLYLEDDGC